MTFWDQPTESNSKCRSKYRILRAQYQWWN